MKISIFLLSALMIGIFLFGCTNQGNNNGVNNTVQLGENNTVQPGKNNTAVQSGALDLSVPSELPTAYVGKPVTYSFSATGGKTPYEFTSTLHRIVYGGITRGEYLSGYAIDSKAGLLNLTAEKDDEGKYIVEICVSDNTLDYYYTPLCKNTTLYIMSDDVKVKGEGKVTSSVVWDPRASVTVRGRGGDFTDRITRPSNTMLVPLSEIPGVNLNVSTPPKDNDPGSPYSLGSSGGASVRFEMVANSTGISQSVVGDAPCGTPRKDGSYEVLNVDSFQVLGETVIGLNITNEGTTEKVVDIIMTGRSAVSSDSTYYGFGGTDVAVYIGSYTDNDSIDIQTIVSSRSNVLKPGDEITDSKSVRVVVAPGSHIVHAGTIEPEFDGGGLGMGGCPTHLGISGGATITTVDANLGDGKLPTRRISADRVDKIE
jgi:hypothetical protein